MTTRHSSSFDAEVIDNTLLSIPEVYVAYVHPTLILVLRLVASTLVYCLLTIFNVFYMALKTILYPVYVMANLFILRPIGFLFYLCHLLYPVAVYLSFAVLCGLLIGGCAGFTAEALSSFFINATWGPSPSSRSETDNIKSKQHQMDTTLDDGDGDANSNDGLDDSEYGSDDNDYEQEARFADRNKSPPPPQKNRFSAISSSLASIWKTTPELDENSDDDESDGGDTSDQDQGTRLNGNRRSPMAPIYSSMASKDKQMMGKGKQAMRQFSLLTTTTTADDHNTPRYRVGKKSMAYDFE